MTTATFKAIAGTPCHCGRDAVEVVAEVGDGRIIEIVEARCAPTGGRCEFCFDPATHHGYCFGHWQDVLERREHAL